RRAARQRAVSCRSRRPWQKLRWHGIDPWRDWSKGTEFDYCIYRNNISSEPLFIATNATSNIRPDAPSGVHLTAERNLHERLTHDRRRRPAAADFAGHDVHRPRAPQVFRFHAGWNGEIL